MQQGSNNNGINNYKGVMLCSRPNQAAQTNVQKPFCGRVVPRQQLGLVPAREQHSPTYEHKKPRLQILDRHKQWLDNFKKDIQSKNKQIEEQQKQEEQKMRRIRQQGEIDRERSRKMKQQYNQTAANVLSILDDNEPPKITSNQLTPQNLNKLNRLNQIEQQKEKESPPKKQNIVAKQQQQFKKNKKVSKPLWAQTQQQIEQQEEDQVDELLDFFSTNHVQDYAQDEQVKQILSNLKNKIIKLQEEEDWKEKELQRMRKLKEERRQKQQQNQDEDNDDKVTHFSAKSDSRSMASEKTQQKIEQLKAKQKEQQQWDKHTTSQKSTVSNIDEKIAKNIADQVLRNYPNMAKIHSNVSIRKMLEAEAAKVMSEPIARPVITTIIREKQKIDANNLPYLHRNPAI